MTLKTTLKYQVKEFLENNVWARARINRYKAVWAILDKRHNIQDTLFKSKFVELGSEIFSINRLINQTQQLNESLRGSDYKDGKILAQETQIDLGY